MSKLDKEYNIKGFVFDVDGVLSATCLPIRDDDQPIRTTNLKDGYAIRVALEAGYKLCIISGGHNDSVKKRYNLLGINEIYLEKAQKSETLKKWMRENDLEPENVAYMGDDIPDLPCLRIVGLPACPYDASSEVLQTAVFISKYTGGYGCVRDLIESVLRSQGDWEKTVMNVGA